MNGKLFDPCLLLELNKVSCSADYCDYSCATTRRATIRLYWCGMISKLQMHARSVERLCSLYRIIGYMLSLSEVFNCFELAVWYNILTSVCHAVDYGTISHI